MNHDPRNYLNALQHWGLHPQRLQEAPEELLYALTTELNRLGLDVGLATICIRTPHPQLDMLVFRWRPLTSEEVPTDGTQSILGQKTTKRADGVQDIYYMVHGHTNEAMWKNSPFYRALDTQTPIRIPLVPPPTNSSFPIIEDLVAREMTDYLVHPLSSDTDVSVALSLVSQRPGGFPQAFMDALDAFVPLLSLSVGFKVERIQFQEVLSAYIGTEPASFVFKGQIHRGDVVSRECALGFADLRGFTHATETLATHNVIELVSTFFELVYRAVYGVGGEILKFMGDGVLFMVPSHDDAQQTCDLALQAVLALIDSVDAYNQDADIYPIQFGCGLHYGTVLYGNIGSPARLDFTVMGPAVNLTSRIEGLTRQTQETCLLSKSFADLTSIPNRCLGTYPLKGIVDEQSIFTPLPSQTEDLS